jgi:hypothetical protein
MIDKDVAKSGAVGSIRGGKIAGNREVLLMPVSPLRAGTPQRPGLDGSSNGCASIYTRFCDFPSGASSVEVTRL